MSPDLRRSILLLADGIVNTVLGLLLLAFPADLVRLLGVPPTEVAFYPSLLGAVLVGIGIALFLELRRRGTGLGLVGAITINICGGAALALWLLVGDLAIPLRGFVFLWSLVVLLVGISLLEALSMARERRAPGAPQG